MWDKKVDVLVIGYGGAGAVAAITSHDEGADVLIVEKMGVGGGNTNVSLGGFLCLTDLKEGRKYLEGVISCVYDTVDQDVIDTFAKECCYNRQWVEELGGKTHSYGGAAYGDIPGASVVEKRLITGENTKKTNSFWAFLKDLVEKRRIDTWFNVQTKSLVINKQKEVIGAEVTSEGKKVRIKAEKGIILACGGFEYNENMKKNYLKGYPYYSLGSPGNTGDGVGLAISAGADLWHMSSVSTPLGFKASEHDAAFFIRPSAYSYIYVDQTGKRFASEFTDIHAYNNIVDFFDVGGLVFPRIPCFMIFDEKTKSKGPLAISALGYNRDLYQWSKDNSMELEKGWIVSDDTIAGLAKKLDLKSDVLQETVKKYNTACGLGHDIEHARPSDKLVSLENGPYYAMKLSPTLLNTQGGPKRDSFSRVIRPDGSYIKGLYSIGELGSVFGLLYQGGGNLGECMAFGRIAGKHAALEKYITDQADL